MAKKTKKKKSTRKIVDNTEFTLEGIDEALEESDKGKKKRGKKKASKKRPVEQYTHEKEKRVNNPPVGLVTPASDKPSGKKQYQYDPHLDPHLDPQLVWAGKAEHTSFEVPTVSLHVHERIDPKTIIEAVRKRNSDNGLKESEQLGLFESPEENPPLREAIDFYKHSHGWTNRLIAGDSLLIMNSLLEKEGMAGKVQMVYIDPPYGIKYGSNFQPFVNKRDVKDKKDDDLSQEPEMVKAFRDTWELGIHSYLTYLRDRIYLAKSLLAESGCIFIQISDENLHHIREICDEVFGANSFLGLITILKRSPQPDKNLSRVTDYLIWYAKSEVKYRQLFKEKQSAGSKNSDFTTSDLTSSHEYHKTPFPYKGKTFTPGSRYWSTSVEGLQNLAKANRLVISGNTLRFKRFIEDFPCQLISNVWDDVVFTGFAEPKLYAVQTSMKVLQRCLLMTTDPGDLVLDITCGSGTTANVAEQWGRRWITCDSSRVSITLAKQRLMTANFDYYELAHSDEGVRSGFKYKTVPHITLKSIANNPEIKEGMSQDEIDKAIAKYADQETLYDQPIIDNKKTRVTGPFTVEAVPAPIVKPLDDAEPAEQPADESIARTGATLRHQEWRDELLRTGIRGKGGQQILFSRVEPLSGTKWLHAEGETNPYDGGKDSIKENPSAPAYKAQRVVISFGPEHNLLEQRQVALAMEEAAQLFPKPDIVVFAAFEFDPEAAKDIDEINPETVGMQLLKIKMNADLLTEDLKKKRSSNESFWLMGQPDVELRVRKDKKYEVEVHGFDYFNTKTGELESGGSDRIAMWMMDTDYDGRSLYPRQVFFPMAGEKEGWNKLAKSLKAEIDEELIESYRGTVSLPFEAGEHRRVGVKIVDDRGIESLKLIDLP